MTSNESDIGDIGTFPEGTPRRVEVNGKTLLVVRKGAEFYAMRDACPHMGASLSGGCVVGIPVQARPGDQVDYVCEGEIVTCPWHGWSFDLKSGRSLIKPDRLRVRTYPVTVVNDRVLVAAG